MSDETRDGGDDACACDVFCYNEELVERLKDSLPAEDRLWETEELFTALANPTRLMILLCLCDADELCVCDISNTLGANVSTISHQLGYLRNAGLLRCRRDGKMVFYRLADERVPGLLREGMGTVDRGQNI